jgi:hypothetical protein
MIRVAGLIFTDVLKRMAFPVSYEASDVNSRYVS